METSGHLCAVIADGNPIFLPDNFDAGESFDVSLELPNLIQFSQLSVSEGWD